MPYKDPEQAREYEREYKRERYVPIDLRPLHVRLGIETMTHMQAVTDYVGGFDRQTGQYWAPHLYRARITLARV